jgi:hypothetical protein
MDRLNLDYEELQQLAHLYHWLPPGVDLKRFLLGHLRHRLPGTAWKIERLEEAELRGLAQQLAASREISRLRPSQN